MDSLLWFLNPCNISLVLTPDTCAEGEFVFEQSSELDEEVDVGVIDTELLFPLVVEKIYID